jgi:hypothetical protein
MTLLGALVGFVAAGLALRGPPEWRGYAAYSIVNTPLALLAALLPVGQYSFYAMLTIVLVWFGVIGSRMLRLSRGTGSGRKRLT